MTDEELDTSSTDALHWAEQFCKTLKKINRAKYPGRRTDMDVDWVQGWFANYWAAVNDPLQKQIDDLYEIHGIKTDQLGNDLFEKDQKICELEKCEKVKTINDFVYVRKDVIFNILNGIENET